MTNNPTPTVGDAIEQCADAIAHAYHRNTGKCIQRVLAYDLAEVALASQPQDAPANEEMRDTLCRLVEGHCPRRELVTDMPIGTDVEALVDRILTSLRPTPQGEVVAWAYTVTDRVTGGHSLNISLKQPDPTPYRSNIRPLTFADTAQPEGAGDAGLGERLKDALADVRSQNAADFKRSGKEWEAYDKAVRDCWSAVEVALAKPEGQKQ